MSTSKRFVTKNGLDNNGNSITNLGVSGASLTLSGANALTFTTSGTTNVTFPTSGTLLTTAGTAATVTTNANLTGPITSVGNATSVASQTGSGSTFVMNTTPSILGFLNITGSGAYMPASTTIAAASAASGASLITSQGTAGTAGAAFITFHRPSAHAFHVGIDTDNFFKIGGYSLGAASYKIWHEGVDGAGSGLDADLLDGQQGAYYAPIASPVFTGTPRASSLNIGADTDIYLYESATNALSIRTGGVGTEKYTTFGADGSLSLLSGGMYSSGRVLIGTNTAVTQSNGETPLLQLNGTDSSWGIGLSRFSANANGTGIYIAKSRGATTGTLGIVVNGDELGRVNFSGDDGTDLNSIGASISAYVDGTPGVNDMPGRLIFSTTADGASTPTERMRIDNAGNVGIGAVPLSTTKVFISNTASSTTVQEYGLITQSTFTNASGAINKFGTYAQAFTGASFAGTATVIGLAGLAQQNAASTGAGFSLVGVLGNIATTSTGTIANACAFQTGLTATGGATIANGIGLLINDHSVGGGKFGIYSAMTAAANKYNIYVAGTADNYFAGNVGIGGNSAGVSLRLAKTLTGATTTFGIRQSGQVQSDSTAEAYGILNEFSTQATAFTLPSYVHLGASQSTIGAGSSVTNQYGVYISSNLIGATNNYGVHSNIPSGSNRYNIYAGGTAENYFAGKVGIGTLLSTNTFFRVSGSGTGTDTSTVIAQGTTTASSAHNVFYSLPTTSATALGALTHFYASQSTLGGTVNNQYGFRADALNIGATNNYGFLAENTAAVTTGKTGFGFYSNINTATGGGSTWGFFSGGTANNAFAGKVRVGGVTVPVATLDVTGTIASTGAITATGGVDKLTTASGVVSVAAATAPSTGQVLMATSATTATWQTPAAGGTVTLSDDTATNATYYPTIATATSGTLSALKVSSTKFTFNPSTGTMSATILNSLSDANFKTNVVPLTDSAEVVKALQGVSFDWKDGSGSSYGFIAQEVQKIIPHAVSENDNKLGVNYSAIVPFLVETIKTQEDRIARLEEMVAKLLKA